MNILNVEEKKFLIALQAMIDDENRSGLLEDVELTEFKNKARDARLKIRMNELNDNEKVEFINIMEELIDDNSSTVNKLVIEKTSEDFLTKLKPIQKNFVKKLVES